MFYVINFAQFSVKSIIFSILDRGLFTKLLEKALVCSVSTYLGCLSPGNCRSLAYTSNTFTILGCLLHMMCRLTSVCDFGLSCKHFKAYLPPPTLCIQGLKDKIKLSRDMRFPTMWFVRPAKAQTSLRIHAV